MLLDLGAVTRTLMNVVRLAVNASPAWPGVPGLLVTPHPPDKLAGDATLGLYLYHLGEDPHFKNQPPPPGNPELRYTPMALQLFYVLTAFAHLDETDGGISTLREQLLLGLGAKALRDHPIIDDATEVAGTPVLDAAITGDGNRIRIALQPLPPNEAVSYFTAGASPLRLSAYYQAQVIFFEPDRPIARTGRVLRYGIQTFVGGSPHLEATDSALAFTLPGETLPRSVAARPAQVAEGGELGLIGSGLAGGVARLWIQGGSWPAAVAVDPSWNLMVNSEGGFATVRGTADTTDVPPGFYTAFVEVTTSFAIPGGGTRSVARRSNGAPFIVIPAVTSTTIPDPSGIFDALGTGYTPAAAVDVYLGELRLTPAAIPASPQPGEFVVQSATRLTLRLPASITPGAPLAVRVITAGAESAPFWMVP
ncbi:MAG TPA: Pvc16 family protein [Kofleriaceae bacterium]|jgi:hypothetical protein